MNFWKIIDVFWGILGDEEWKAKYIFWYKRKHQNCYSRPWKNNTLWFQCQWNISKNSRPFRSLSSQTTKQCQWILCSMSWRGHCIPLAGPLALTMQGGFISANSANVVPYPIQILIIQSLERKMPGDPGRLWINECKCGAIWKITVFVSADSIERDCWWLLEVKETLTGWIYRRLNWI